MSLSDIKLCVACGKPLSPSDGSQYHPECLAAKCPTCGAVGLCGDGGPGDCGHGVIVHGGSHGGGKMHMTEQQNKALLEKDPDYAAKLMTPANTPGKSDHVLSLFNTDSANPVRLSFQNEGEPIFSIGPDGAVTVNPDIELDDVGRAFWKAVERTAPSTKNIGHAVHELAERFIAAGDLKDVRDKALNTDYEQHELRVLAGMMAEHKLARVEILPANPVKGFGPRGLDRSHMSHRSTYQVIVVNGVGIIGVAPGSIILQNIEKALKNEPEP